MTVGIASGVGIRQVGHARVHAIGPDGYPVCGAGLRGETERVRGRDVVNCPRCLSVRSDRKRRRERDETTGDGYPIGQVKIISPLTPDKLPKYEITVPFGTTKAEMRETRRLAVEEYFALGRDLGAA
jgi:hypothetical protein